LVIKGPVEIDNLCTCRASREAGIICAHSVALGLHHLLSTKAPPRGSDTATPLPARPSTPGQWRTLFNCAGLCAILPDASQWRHA
jgi:hypothetical protein